MTKTILGLDLGTNSIGWALVQQDFENKQGEILGMGSRIIPMSQDILGEFGRGNSISQTAERTGYRGVRRLRERHLLRRERLHRTLNILGFLPKHYANEIDFTKRFGKFINHAEPKLPYKNGDFLFKKSFLEMLEDFKSNQPEFLKDKNGNNCLVPYDWTIYYLRKKALSQKIEKEELAWLILNFNQKRGYYQLRGEDFAEEKDKLFVKLKVDKVVDSGEKIKGNILHDVYFDNGWKYDRQIVKTEDWVGKTKEFIVTESCLKNGDIKRTYKAVDSEKDWIAIKSKTEQDIDNSNKTVGTYIYENLLLNPKQKIKGKLVRTIERKFYKEELNQILRKQQEFHSELQNEELLQDCVRELYKHNEQHQQMLESKDFVHLFLNDIIFYQRPLRSQKSSISNCTLEKRISKEGVVFSIKVISKSNPYYQEFRLLQWLQNLEIYRNEDDTKVTTEFITSVEDKEALFDFLNSKKEVEQKHVIDFLLKQKSNKNKLPKGEAEKYRWNYVQDKKYPMNETRYLIQSKLDKVEDVPNDFLSFENEMALWHIIYSVNDKIEYEKALAKFALKHQLDEASFVESFKKFPPFKSDYGSFSEKAIKKLLPLMRFGNQWNYDAIDNISKERIYKIITGEYDEKIKNRVREKAEQFNLTTENNFQNLPLWLAQYVAYGRHSEAEITGKWNSVSDLENYLKEFKQHSLRNPIVEQVITETLRVVKDIWQEYGKGAQDFFSEIHIELGREMKNTADERKRLTNVVTENENTNLRIKALLAELALDATVENVRPYSPMQQDILKIYEEGVLNAEENIEEDILKISKTAQPSSSDLKRYKLWLEQRYRSPYTGQMIPLNKLFSHEYEIEHIIPQSLFFDDSLSNKIICESAVNKLKDNRIGLAFIKAYHGEVVPLGNGKTVKILEVQDYEDFVKQNYSKNRTKRNKLLMEDIPEKMIERQLNDTRYISKYISHLLSNIVRDVTPDSKDDGINSINVLPGNGKITTRLKQDWGLNDVWNELILPRFERMNELTNSTDFTSTNTNGKVIPTVPIELSKGFSKKRIDHRHHAMDALVIACATRDHVNLLNNESAKSETTAKSETKRYDLNRKLRVYEKVTYKDQKTGEQITREVPKDFLKPWTQFTIEAKNALENIVVSFKQNTRVINKATNYYESYKDENGNLRFDKNGKPKKDFVEQKGMNWAVRKPLHKETVSGQVHLDRVKVAKGKILSATRKSLDTTFNEKTIQSITDTGIQKILLNYLKAKGSPEVAFSPEGIEEMNKTISLYNEGKNHQPILKVRVFEQGSKFPLGETGNKTKKFVEAAKGTNLFFGIYEDKAGKRSYNTIPLNLVIERQKQGLSPVSEINDKGHRLLFHLSPNDLVVIPKDGDINSKDVYKVVSFTGGRLYVIPHFVSSVIVNKIEYTQLNKIELTKEKDLIKKIEFDRLGNLISKSSKLEELFYKRRM
ncbi:type II CRISPR RNA-guided endonuclease Cas9 [Empedobacter sp. UBA5987]|uniref:type II CRISPR RNA-guided endonuclease Cas9 n=1 Tax=Empedobacter sp. UBA5987 TaxID=1946444 RepID=UPI0025BC0023|nr:type II CRISPR RNA-guided endonuclease Cas9 [Empedobacter sp. UBA5987]